MRVIPKNKLLSTYLIAVLLSFFLYNFIDAQAPVLEYASYFGSATSTSKENVIGVVEDNGEIYTFFQIEESGNNLTGVNSNVYMTSGANHADLALSKQDADGNVIWSTYIASDADDYQNHEYNSKRKIIFDANVIYLIGIAQAPLAGGGFQNTHSGDGNEDGFVIAIDATSGALIWGRYLGGAGVDRVHEMHLYNGELIVVGDSAGDLELTSDANQATYGGGTNDIFVARLDAATGGLNYASYLGGNNREVDGTLNITTKALKGVDISSVVVNGELCIVAATASLDYPTSATAIATTGMNTYAPSGAFLTENEVLTFIDLSTNNINYSTYTNVANYSTNNLDFITAETYSGKVYISTGDAVKGAIPITSNLIFDGEESLTVHLGVWDASTKNMDYGTFIEKARGANIKISPQRNSWFSYGLHPILGADDVTSESSAAYETNNFPWSTSTVWNDKGKGYIIEYEIGTNNILWGGVLYSTRVLDITWDVYGNLYTYGKTELTNSFSFNSYVDIGVFDDRQFLEYGANGVNNVSGAFLKIDENYSVKYGTYLNNCKNEGKIIVNDDIVRIVTSISPSGSITTDNAIINHTSGTEGITYYKINMCTPLAATNDLTPMSQDVCILGRTQAITGTLAESDPDAVNAPDILWYNNQVHEQEPHELNYQWQVSNDNITWDDIPGAVLKNFLPPPTSADIYYRRIVGVEPCRDTSAVATVLINGIVAPVLLDGSVFTCPDTDTQIGMLATNGSGNYSYEWLPDLLLDDNTLAMPTYNGPDGGIYNIVVTDDDTGCQFEEQWQVNILVADAGDDGLICGSATGDQIGTAGMPGGNFTYTWTSVSGDPISSLNDANIPQPIASPTATTEYQLTLMINDQNCSTTDNTTVFVGGTTVDAGPDATLCIGETLMMGEAPQSNHDYGWAPGIYITTQIQSQTTLVSSLCPGEDGIDATNNPLIYTLTKIDNATGCSAVDTIEVALLQLDLENDYPACPTVRIGEGETCGLDDLDGSTFSWSVLSGDANSIVGQENERFPVVTPDQQTTYQMELCYGGRCCTDVVNVTLDCGSGCNIDLYANSQIGCPVGGSHGTNLVADFTFFGSANSLPSGFHYEWNPTTALSDPTSLNPTVGTLASDQTYTFQIINDSDNAVLCSDNVTVYATVAPSPIIDIEDKLYGCNGQVVTLGEPAVAGWDYVWYDMDGAEATGLDPSNMVAQPMWTVDGSEEFVLVVTDAITNCFYSDTISVTSKEPIANAGPDQTFCANAIVTFGTPPQPHHTYSWTPVVGLAQPNIAQPIDTLFVEPAQPYTLVTTDTLTGCTATDDLTFTITDPPVADAGPDVEICADGSGSTIGTMEVAGLTYQWTPQAGLNNADIAQPIASPAAGETYTLYVLDESSVGCFASDEVSITVGSSYMLDAPDALVCSGAAVNIGVADEGGTYSWSPTTNLTDPNSSQTDANPTETTTYTLTWVTPDGCAVSDEVIVEVGTPPVLALNDVTICEGSGNIIGQAGLVDIDTYVWTAVSGDGIGTLNADNIAQPFASPTQTTTYELTVTTIHGCISTAQVTLTVNPLPDIDLGPDVPTCNDINLSVTINSGSADTYNWSTGETTASISVNPTAATNYSVTVSDAAGCTDSDDIVVTPTFTLDAGSNKIICAGNETTIGTPDASGGTFTYTWTAISGDDITSLDDPNSPQPMATPNQTTEYELSVDDGAGCIKTDRVTVTVNPLPAFDLGVNQTICNGACVELNTNLSSGYSFYWEPAIGTTNDGVVSVCPTATTSYSVTVLDNSTNCLAGDNITINVLATPAPNADAGADQSICSGETVAIGAPSAATDITYAWSPTDFLSDAYSSNPNVTIINSSGVTEDYTYILMTTDNNTLCVNQDTVVVRVNPVPMIDATIDQTICSGGQYTIPSLNISPSSPDYTYSWTPTTGVSDPTIETPTLSPESSTLYNVFVENTVTGCANAKSVNINVREEQFSVEVGDDVLVCADESAMLSVSSDDPNASYMWSYSPSTPGFLFNVDYVNGTSNTSAEPEVESTGFFNVGLRTFTVVATSDSGNCIETRTVAVDFGETGGAADPGTNRLLCGVDMIMMEAVAAVSGTFGTWSQVNGPNTANIVEPTNESTVVSNLIPGVYTFRWTTENDAAAETKKCDVGFADVIIEVAQNPNLVIADDVEGCDYADITLPNLTSGSTGLGTFSYWIDEATTNLPVARPDSVTVQGTYYIKTTDEKSCTDVAPINVLLIDCIFDFGDLPELTTGLGTGDYNTSDGVNGPFHRIIDGLAIGAVVDDELDGAPNGTAEGDDNDGIDDEDGIDVSAAPIRGMTMDIPVSITNMTGEVAHLEIWIDWNGDGDFDDPGEFVADLSDDGAGNLGLTSISVPVPNNAVANIPLGARARLSHTDDMTPYGFAFSGEVEDYIIMLSCTNGNCLPIIIERE